MYWTGRMPTRHARLPTREQRRLSDDSDAYRGAALTKPEVRHAAKVLQVETNALIAQLAGQQEILTYEIDAIMRLNQLSIVVHREPDSTAEANN